MKYIVMYSGGVTSWAAARRTIERHGRQDVTLLFAHTRAEDDDLYRFLADTEDDLGIAVTWVEDGRTPWQVFWDRKWIGNSRIAPCSHILKQDPCRRWLEANCEPHDSEIIIGIDATAKDRARVPTIANAWQPWRVATPLLDSPPIDKRAAFVWLEERSIDPPALYDLGFTHNNCGGACVRGGQGQWLHLLKVNPGLYAEHEEQERQFRTSTGKDISILRDRRDGDLKPLTLEDLRMRPRQADLFVDWAGDSCSCFTAIDSEVPA